MYLERTDPVNWSTAKEILKSPKHYLHLLAQPRKDTDAMRLGRLTHTMVYEPDVVARRHPVRPNYAPEGRANWGAPACEKNGYAGTYADGQEWDAEHVGSDPVTADQLALAGAMRDAILADPIAAPLVAGGYAEQSITWRDDETGIECRGRVDHLNGRLSDLKTARSVVPREFLSQAARLHYFAQIAWYLDGCLANGLTFQDRPALIVVENVAPHDVLALEFYDDDIAAGRETYRRALRRLQECRLTTDTPAEWPGVSGGVVHRAEPPAWYLSGGVAEQDIVLEDFLA